MINALNSSIDIGNVKYLYAVACIFGMTVGAGVHVTLSKLFPDRLSLIDEAILAADVLEGRVQWAQHSDDGEKYDHTAKDDIKVLAHEV